MFYRVRVLDGAELRLNVSEKILDAVRINKGSLAFRKWVRITRGFDRSAQYV